jgi:MoaA/NifB/PqqE/SkfB family radical SAM enzyme
MRLLKLVLLATWSFAILLAGLALLYALRRGLFQGISDSLMLLITIIAAGVTCVGAFVTVWSTVAAIRTEKKLSEVVNAADRTESKLSEVDKQVEKYTNYRHLNGFEEIVTECIGLIKESGDHITIRSYFPTFGLLEKVCRRNEQMWQNYVDALTSYTGSVRIIMAEPSTAALIYREVLLGLSADLIAAAENYQSIVPELNRFGKALVGNGKTVEIFYDLGLSEEGTLGHPIHHMTADHAKAQGEHSVLWFLPEGNWTKAEGFWTNAEGLVQSLNHWTSTLYCRGQTNVQQVIAEWKRAVDAVHEKLISLRNAKTVGSRASTPRSPSFIRGLDFAQDQIVECRDEGKLLAATLEISRECNLNCRYCYAGSGPGRRDGELNQGELCTIIDQVAALGAKTITIVGGGEPLMVPESTFGVLEHANAKGLNRVMFTNATLINYDVAKRLHDLGVSVIAKFNSFSPAIQDFLAGQQGAALKISQGIRYLQQVGYGQDGQDSPSLSIETVVTNWNIHEIEDIWRWCRNRTNEGGLNAVPYVELLTLQGRAKDSGLGVSSSREEKLFRRLSTIDREDYGYEWEPHPPIAGFSCRRFFFNCYVTSIGHVQPCVGVTRAVGNWRDTGSMTDILKKKPWKDFRNIEKHLKGKCGSCYYGMNMACYGCRGNVYNIAGDVFGEDIDCWLSCEERRAKDE